MEGKSPPRRSVTEECTFAPSAHWHVGSGHPRDRESTMVHERRWLISIFALYFVLGAGYSLVMPMWEAPDEGAHYHLAWYLAYKGQYAPPEMNYEAGQSRGFYYAGSLVLRALNTIDSDLTWYRFPKEFKYN